LLNDWQNVDITRIIEDKFKLPVVLTNTSMAKIRAIDRIEIKGAVENIIFIEYGDGIGCGLKLAGNYVPGSSSISGELGHMRVTDEQIICRCGKVGCLEAVSALPALESKAKAIIREETETLLNGQSEISGICIFEAAAKGDRLCTHIVEEAFEYLARAIANLINVINPEIIVLESLISKVGENAYSHLLRAIEKNTLSTHWQSLEVKFSGIEQYLGPLGGASTILDLCIERSL
jgi:glucokinase